MRSAVSSAASSHPASSMQAANANFARTTSRLRTGSMAL
jgi:hypothetical protein